MKRTLATLLAVLLLLTAVPFAVTAAPTDAYGYYYQHLSDTVAQRAYAAIVSARNVLSVKVDLPELEKYHYNDPQFSNEVEKIQERILIGAWCWRYDHVRESDFFTNNVSCSVSVSYDFFFGMDCTATVIMEYHPGYTPSMEAQRDAAIEAIAAEADKQPTVYGKLLSIHDQLANRGTYDYDALNITDYSSRHYLYAHSSLGILLDGLGVCESYAKSFRLVCDEMGITDCVCLISKTHMWNAIKVDGVWYGVDVTWDDQERSSGPMRTYFLCPDPDVVDGRQTDHVVDTTFTVSPSYATTAYQPVDEVTTISLHTLPTKRLFTLEQDSLDVTGGKLAVSYLYSTDKVIDLTLDMVSGFDNTKVGEQTLTITYGGKTVTYTVVVLPVESLEWEGAQACADAEGDYAVRFGFTFGCYGVDRDEDYHTRLAEDAKVVVDGNLVDLVGFGATVSLAASGAKGTDVPATKLYSINGDGTVTYTVRVTGLTADGKDNRGRTIYMKPYIRYREDGEIKTRLFPLVCNSYNDVIAAAAA